MKKLKRNPMKLESIKKEPIKKKLILKTKKTRCAFIGKNGEQCKARTSGKGNFCSLHSETTFREITHHNPMPMINTLAVKYDPIYHPFEFVKLSNEGMNPKEIASIFNVSLDTIENWRNTYPMFDQAYDIGKVAHEAWYLRTGKDNLDNRWFQTPLFKFLAMNNGLGWTDKVDSRSQVQGQFGVLLMPGQLSVDEWEAQNIKREEELQKRLEAEEIISIENTETGEIDYE